MGLGGPPGRKALTTDLPLFLGGHLFLSSKPKIYGTEKKGYETGSRTGIDGR